MVIVTINSVGSSDLDPIIIQGENDLYAKVNIAQQGFQQSPTIDNANNITPSNWVFTRRIDQPSIVPIDIEVWDEDIGPDDQVDISPKGNDLNFRYNAASGQIVSGDTTIPPDFIGDGQNGAVGYSINTRGVSEYSQDMTFQTTGQSMWGTGTSTAGEFKYFLGAEWNNNRFRRCYFRCDGDTKWVFALVAWWRMLGWG